MNKVQQLIQETEQARERFLGSVGQLGFAQVTFKPEPEIWSITEIAEHMVRAEQSGVSGMWKALDGMKKNEPVWSGDPIHKGLSIEEVVERTWQPKEQVPEIAAPIWRGSISYWIASLKAQKSILSDLGAALDGQNIEEIIYPHPISGPLDIRQRLEFLRFHLDRHREQIENLKQHPNFA